MPITERQVQHSAQHVIIGQCDTVSFDDLDQFAAGERIQRGASMNRHWHDAICMAHRALERRPADQPVGCRILEVERDAPETNQAV